MPMSCVRRVFAVHANRSDCEGGIEDAVVVRIQGANDAIACFESLYVQKAHLGSGRDRLGQERRFAAIGSPISRDDTNFPRANPEDRQMAKRIRSGVAPGWESTASSSNNRHQALLG